MQRPVPATRTKFHVRSFSRNFSQILKPKKSYFLALCFCFTIHMVQAQQWKIIGNEQQVASAASAFTTIATVTDGSAVIPYVAFVEAGALKVKKYDGESWLPVGGNVAPGASYSRIYADEAGNIYVTYVENVTNKLAVKQYDKVAGTWQPLGNNAANLYVSSGSVNFNIGQYSSTPRSALAFDRNNTPYVVFGEGAAGLSPVVKRFVAGSWETVGSAPVSAQRAIGVGIAIDNTNVPFVVYINQATATSSTGKLVMYRYEGLTNSWIDIPVPSPVPGGSSATGATTALRHSAITLNSSGNPVVAYFNANNSNKATAIVYNKITNTWNYSAVLSTRDASAITLTKDKSGDVYASFLDVITNGSGRSVARVRKLEAGGTSWSELIHSGASVGIVEPAAHLAISGSESGTPYIVYTQRNSSGEFTPVVRYFTNTPPPPPPPVEPDPVVTTPKQMEALNRGLVAVRSNNEVYVGWRLWGTDPSGISFNVYRDGVKLNASPITNSTNYVDAVGTTGAYTIRPVVNGVEGAATKPVTVWGQNHLAIPLQVPAGGVTPAGVSYTYTANDCSVGDVDGDGEYEIILKWDPTNAKDNSQAGYTGNVYLDAYKLDGTRLWRIDLGKNIRAGAHYTQFIVYDLDGDGKAEVACKTADGTIDGTGVVIGNPLADFRNSSGYILSGPEFLTVFNGLTGKAMATTDYIPARGNVSSWGDSYGNRVDRFVAAVAYLDGARPSLIMGRGYYTRLVRAAYDFRDGKLTLRWVFDSNTPGNGAYAGQGNHQMSIGDVDGDGKDEICNGSSTINDDGKGLYANGLGHGDALHMTDLDPDRPGQEVWQCHEDPGSYGQFGLEFRDAKTGTPLWGVATTGDIGRAMAADVDPAHKGYEVWGSAGGLYTNKGVQISTSKPSMNFGLWWDGDLSRELLDGTKLDKWNPATKSSNRLFTIYNTGTATHINGTKANPNLSADLLGDWREEMIFRSADNTQLLLFTTTLPTDHRIYTLMHDAQYRTAIAWQNSSYNQPPHPSFYLGNDMPAPPVPNIVLTDIVEPSVESSNRSNPSEEMTAAKTVTYRVTFTEAVKNVDATDFTLALTGTANGNINAVVNVSENTVYDVVVDVTAYGGTMRLDVNSAGTGITDNAGNALTTGFTTGQQYILGEPPTITCPAPISVNNTAGLCTGLVEFTGSHAANATGIPAPVITYKVGNLEVNETYPFPLGTTTVTAIASNGIGSDAICNFTVTVADNEAPVITNVSVNPEDLGVPDHKMRDITVSYTTSDNCTGVVTKSLSVTSNEPTNGNSDGNTSADWQVEGEHAVKLRAERAGSGSGRVYTITITAQDAAGNTSSTPVHVYVRQNMALGAAGALSRIDEATFKNINEDLAVQVLPNPSTKHFTLVLKSNSSERVQLKVVDALGRIVDTRSGIAANGSFRVGESLQPGIYYAELRQGNKRVVVKLLKQPK